MNWVNGLGQKVVERVMYRKPKAGVMEIGFTSGQYADAFMNSLEDTLWRKGRVRLSDIDCVTFPYVMGFEYDKEYRNQNGWTRKELAPLLKERKKREKNGRLVIRLPKWHELKERSI